MTSKFLACLLLASLAGADEVVLNDGSNLTGRVNRLSPDGRLVLDSPLAEEPFEILGNQVRSVNFAISSPAKDVHDTLVILTNGDQFSADLEGLDETKLRLRTSFSDSLEIPRDRVQTLQLGMRPRRVLYRGPVSADGWNIRSGWIFQDRQFSTPSSGTLSHEFDLPSSYALKFQASWRNLPNFELFFCSPTLETTSGQDRYRMTFNIGGIDIRRDRAQSGGRELPIISIARESSTFTANRAEVELRIDRRMRRLHLYINGERLGQWSDPAPDAPKGSHLIFRASPNGDDQITISKIEIREWDPSADRHRSEERGDPSKDVIISRESDRGTVRLIGHKAGPDGGSFIYQGLHDSSPQEIPALEVSTLFFARNPDLPTVPSTPFLLKLRNRGSLSASECQFEGDEVKLNHPLLGLLVFKRQHLLTLTQKAGADPAAAEDGPAPNPDQE